MDFQTLVPGPTDRAAFIGQTGSGKTTLAREILAWREWVVVYDPKRLIRWPGYEVHTDLAKLVRSDSPRLIYRPDHDELHGAPDAMEPFFHWVYERRNTTVYVDEVYLICVRTEYPRWYGACLRQGRERGVSVFTSTQRPASVPVVCLSESEYDYLFTLKVDHDRKRVEELTGVPQDVVQGLPKHHFVFAPQSEPWVGPLSLNLPQTTSPNRAPSRGRHGTASSTI